MVVVVHSPPRAREVRLLGDGLRPVVIRREHTAKYHLMGLSEEVVLDEQYAGNVLPHVLATARDYAVGCNMAARARNDG
jgi:hypothetical protein